MLALIHIQWIVGIIFIILYCVTILGLVLVIITENRNPLKTIPWVIVLLLAPGIGLLFYFFFGQDNRKQRIISRRTYKRIMKRPQEGKLPQDACSVPAPYQPLVTLLTNSNQSSLLYGSNITIYTNGADKFHDLLQEIAKATHHIHIQYYIFCDDEVGNKVKKLLIEKAKEGVEVRVLYDDVGCWNVSHRFFERMREGGVDVRPFLPVRFPTFTGKVNYRNHRKIVVIDGRTGFIGGMNIALRYVKGTGTQAWRDTMVRITGGALYGLQRAFLVDWYFVDRTLISSRKYYPQPDGSVASACIAQIVTSSPIAPYPDIMQGYVRIILGARRYIYIETPYFLPTEPVLFALKTASVGGIDIRIIVPRHSDSRFVEWAGRSYLRNMVEAGVKIYMYTAGFMHSKLLVCDDSLATCGSTNVDFRSFENNFEGNAFFYDEETAMRFKQVFLADQERSVLFNDTAQGKQPNFMARLWESLIRLLSPVL